MGIGMWLSARLDGGSREIRPESGCGVWIRWKRQEIVTDSKHDCILAVLSRGKIIKECI